MSFSEGSWGCVLVACRLCSPLRVGGVGSWVGGGVVGLWGLWGCRVVGVVGVVGRGVGVVGSWVGSWWGRGVVASWGRGGSWGGVVGT